MPPAPHLLISVLQCDGLLPFRCTDSKPLLTFRKNSSRRSLGRENRTATAVITSILVTQCLPLSWILIKHLTISSVSYLEIWVEKFLFIWLYTDNTRFGWRVGIYVEVISHKQIKKSCLLLPSILYVYVGGLSQDLNTARDPDLFVIHSSYVNDISSASPQR